MLTKDIDSSEWL